MSSFLQQSTLQMPIFSSQGFAVAWTHDCTLCLAPCGAQLVCASCAAALDRRGAVCERCASPLDAPEAACRVCENADFSFDRALSRFDYRFPVDRLVQRFKYGGDLAIGHWLARSLTEALVQAPRVDLLVVPPLGAARLRERGFNQALEIARVLAAGLRVPIAREAIVRTRDTPAQAGLGRDARRANAREAFACRMKLDGARIAIVDDVLTTGATADAIARTVKSAGALSVDVWTLARAPERSSP